MNSIEKELSITTILLSPRIFKCMYINRMVAIGYKKYKNGTKLNENQTDFVWLRGSCYYRNTKISEKKYENCTKFHFS